MLKEIRGVEIFAAGTWNGDVYELADLDAMVQAFEKTKNLFKPYLKLGHNDDQKLLAKDGLPAAGWIGSIYRIGEKLFADFVDIPQKIFELIENKAYRKVSSEIYWNIKIEDTKYPYLLGAVALLGADTPAVSNLNDILSMYGLKEYDKIKIYTPDQNSDTVKQYSFIPENAEDLPMPKTEAEIKLELELKTEQDKNAKAEADAKTYAKERDEKDAEIAKLKADKAESDKRALDSAVKAEQARIESYITSLVSEKVITPAMKPYVAALLGEEKKEYSLKVTSADKEEEKKFSKEDLVKQILKLHTAVAVNTTEGSVAGQEANVSGSDDALNDKIEKYMADNECSYKAAYKAVCTEQKPRASKTMATMEEASA